MWQEDDPSGEYSPDDERLEQETPAEPELRGEHFGSADEGSPPAEFPGNLFPPTILPSVVPLMDIYEAARSRAVADQQLSKLFNPEYYI